MLRTASDPKKSLYERRTARVEIQKKFSLPAACLLFALVECRSGSSRGAVAGRPDSRSPWPSFSATTSSSQPAKRGRWTERSRPGSRCGFPTPCSSSSDSSPSSASARDRTSCRDCPPGGTHGGSRTTPARPLSRARTPRPHAPLLRRARRLFLLVDGYVAGRFLRIFALALLSMSFLYLLIDYLEISESIVKNRIGPASSSPTTRPSWPRSSSTSSVAFLAAALVTTAGLVRSGEATALLAHGPLALRMVASLLLFAAATGVVLSSTPNASFPGPPPTPTATGRESSSTRAARLRG